MNDDGELRAATVQPWQAGLTAQQLLRLAAQGLWMFDDPPTREAAGGVILATPCQEGLALLLEFELAAIVPDCEGVIHLPAILVEGEHLEVP